MDVMGEALEIGRKDMVSLGVQEAELSARNAGDIIDRICAVAGNFTAKAESLFPGQITQDTMRTIQGRINDSINRLR